MLPCFFLLRYFLHIVALILMILGLSAAVKHTNDNKVPALNTMHSWVGIGATVVFCSNFLWGGGMAFLTNVFPEANLRLLVGSPGHKVIGAAALMMSVMAINTGIMDKLPQGACFYEFDNPNTQFEK